MYYHVIVDEDDAGGSDVDKDSHRFVGVWFFRSLDTQPSLDELDKDLIATV